MITPTVHILATVRKPELLPAATLVFSTLRVGFPTNPVMVWGNGLDAASERVIAAATASVQGVYRPLRPTCHDGWIDSLLRHGMAPFWICDTDVAFWVKMNERTPQELMVGRFEPEFDEEWTKTRHMARLHTAVMWLNPGPLRCAIREWVAKIPMPWRATAEFPLVRQNMVPLLQGVSTEGERGRVLTLFYDTCAGLYHAIGGTAFEKAEDAAFDHLHCATYVDEVGKALGGQDLAALHQGVYNYPPLARGIKASQDLYYKSRSPKEPLCPLVQE